MKNLIPLTITLFSTLILTLAPIKLPATADPLEQLVKEHASEMYKRHGIILSGMGGQFLHGFKVLNLAFDWPKKSNEEELRLVLIDGVNQVLEALNRNEELRNEMVDYPMTPVNIDYTVSLEDDDGGPIRDGLSSCSTSNNIVYFFEVVPPNGAVNIYHEETFEEAQQKVAEANN